MATAELDPVALILKAASFAAEKHRHQRRKDADASPYINHPLAVARLLANEGGIADPVIICAALLHDCIEDTDTTFDELVTHFGIDVARIVAELTDDKSLTKEARKRAQVEAIAMKSEAAKLVKIADKTCNLRDIHSSPPARWTLKRKQQYFDWAAQVVAGARGLNPALERAFDAAMQNRPTGA